MSSFVRIVTRLSVAADTRREITVNVPICNEKFAVMSIYFWQN